MKKSKLLFLSIIFPVVLLSQNYKVQKDTLYLLYLETTLSNGRPVFSYVLLDDLSLPDTLANIASFGKYICSLYNAGIYTTDLYLGFQSMMNYFSAEDFSLMEKEIVKSIERLNNSYHKIGVKYFCDHNPLNIEVAKFYCEYWVLDENKPEVSEYIEVPDNCMKDRFYIIKRIFEISGLRKSELKKLETKLVDYYVRY